MNVVAERIQPARASAERSTAAQTFRGGSSIALALQDVAMFVVAALAAEAFVYRTFDPGALALQFIAGPIVFVVLWMVVFDRVGLYRISFAMNVRDEIYIVATALFLGIVPQLMLFTLVPALAGSRMVLVAAASAAIVFVGGARAVRHALSERAAALRPGTVAIAARAGETAAIAAALELTPGSRIIAAGSDPVSVADGDALVERCAQLGCTALYLKAIPPETVMTRLVERARAARLDVAIAPAALRGGSYRFVVEHAGSQTLLRPRPLRVRTAYASFVKRVFDVLVATCALFGAAPVMVLAAIAIAIESGRPIFYRQIRVGMDGIPFQMLKFRSMSNGHNGGNAWATRGDPRITRVGAVLRRFSIDELPQMFNVLRGDMSVVGPRPEIPEYVDRFEREVPRYADRHLVKPGITGWSQLYMDRLLTPDDVVDVLRHDLFYIEHWGVFMDLSIVAKTAAEFLFHRAP
jgi:exopolysaccharide biosynthesis polyprenyl glycosylphosphotransferase